MLGKVTATWNDEALKIEKKSLKHLVSVHESKFEIKTFVPSYDLSTEEIYNKILYEHLNQSFAVCFQNIKFRTDTHLLEV